MEYTVFRHLKRRRLLKNLEEEYKLEKRRKYDNEAIENCKTPRKPLSEAVLQRCSVKKVFLKISQNSQENSCARVCF